MSNRIVPCIVPRLLVSIAFLGSACAGLDDFEVEITDEATIDGSYMTNIPGDLGFGGRYQGLDLSASKEFTDQDIDPDDVDAVYVQSISIVATNPENARLDPIIKLVEFNIEAPGQNTELLGRSILPDGTELREIIIGQPAGGTCSDNSLMDQTACENAGQEWSAPVLNSDLNLKNFATAEQMSLTAKVSLKQQPLFTTSLRTTIKLLIDINLF